MTMNFLMLAALAANPYLPAWEHVPDAEPRIFGDRLYVYGSHDRSGGWDFCLEDYVGWSAPTNDLSAWRKEGVIFAKTDDPSNRDGKAPLYAPDCVRGLDGRYYLYYALDRAARTIGVAVCDMPAGRFRYLADVHYEDGTSLGLRQGDGRPFDPAVLVDDGRVFLYLGGEGSAASVTELKTDMVTALARPKPIVPNGRDAAGTEFGGHGFFEASSIRRIDGEYVFVYAGQRIHELCWATATNPCGPFRYRGVLVSNTDLGVADRPLAAGGNIHGGLVQLGGDWYVFYHRQTQNISFSRQGCAERLERGPDGAFRQAALTSQGLHGGPLPGRGEYPAYIACNLFLEKSPEEFANDAKAHPRIVEERVAGIVDGTVAGFKYFDCRGVKTVSVTTRGWAGGRWEVRTDLNGPAVATLVTRRSLDWVRTTAPAAIPDGVHALYFTFRGPHGCGAPDLKSIALD